MVRSPSARLQPSAVKVIGEAIPDESDPSAEAAAAGEPGEEEVERRSAVVSEAEHGQRLDKMIVGMAPEFSRSHLQTLAVRGLVTVDGTVRLQPAKKLVVGQRVEVQLVPTPESQAFRPEAMDLAVLYEDSHLMVVDKPVGLVVHPAAGHWSGTLLNGLLAHHAGAASLPRAGIVHRLDKDTSGLMVVGKTLEAVTALVRMIAAREVKREYLALAQGTVSEEPFSIDEPIGRDPKSRVKMAVVPHGKTARTDVERVALAVFENPVSAIVCRLHTGRTHQIRVHLASTGHPLLSDAVYGGRPDLGLVRQALHARRLSFDHPITGETMSFEAPLPADFGAAWTQVIAAHGASA